MQKISQEPLDEVLGYYGIRGASIRNESYKDKKGVWWVQAPDGMKILKKVSSSEETLRHILHAVRHLSSNGILFPAVNRTLEGSDYVNLNGTCYVLSDAIDGKNPSYASPAQLALVVKELARFHKASSGFKPLPGTKPKYHLGTWLEDYRQQLADMEQFFDTFSASSQPNEAEKIILREFPYFRARALKAIEGLEGDEYRTWTAKLEKDGCLCHQDFAAGNLILTPADKLYVLDTDSITVDMPARDIRKLLNKIMKKTGKWDLELTKQVLAYYQSQNPLTPAEWQVVRLDLTFPHLFIGAMNKYCYKREKEWTLQNYAKRLAEVSVLERTAEPVLDQFPLIIP